MWRATCICKRVGGRTVSLSLENNDSEKFAIGEQGRDLQDATDALKGLDIQVDPDGQPEPAKSSDKLEAFKPGPSDDRPRRVDSLDDLRQQNGPAGRGPLVQTCKQ